MKRFGFSDILGMTNQPPATTNRANPPNTTLTNNVQKRNINVDGVGDSFGT
jgi:hypothetical protein